MYRWVEHTAELELAIEAPSEREVLADALAALRELLDPAGAASGGERRRVSVRARDRPGLLAAWLEELVYLAEREGFVGCALGDVQIAETELRTTVRGGGGEPPPIVKAVTYHRLTFAPAGDGYVATVVLDV